MNILAHDKSSVTAVRSFEAWAKTQPQVSIDTQHIFWAGCYARTVVIPKGTIITGAQIKIPTLLIVQGDVNIGEIRLSGYHILQGNAGRKNAFWAHEDSTLTMIFATDAKDIAKVEEEFTDEAHNLGSRRT